MKNSKNDTLFDFYMLETIWKPVQNSARLTYRNDIKNSVNWNDGYFSLPKTSLYQY